MHQLKGCDMMYVGFAKFNVKSGKEKRGIEHMKRHLHFSKKCKGFIHGYIAKSKSKPREYIVIEEYETDKDYNKTKELLKKEAESHKKEFFDFFHLLEKEPLIGLYEKIEFTKVKISPVYRKILKRFHEKKNMKKKCY